MNIIKREWHTHAKSLVFWTIGCALLIILSCYKVGSMNGSGGGMAELLDGMPKIIKVMIGGALSFDIPLGLYGVLHSYLALALFIHSVLLGSLLFYHELADKTYEFLYVKGVSRNHILINKTICGIALLIILNILCYLITCLSISITLGEVVIFDFIPIFITLFGGQLLLFVVGLLLSLVLKRSSKAGSIGSLLVFAMLLIDYYIKLGGANILKHFSIFSYMEFNAISISFPFVLLITILLISFMCYLGCLYLHNRKDLS